MKLQDGVTERFSGEEREPGRASGRVENIQPAPALSTTPDWLTLGPGFAHVICMGI